MFAHISLRTIAISFLITLGVWIVKSYIDFLRKLNRPSDKE